jgi:hypothetical protein
VKKQGKLKDVSRLDDFGVIDDTRTRYRGYAAAASKLNPKERAAWWRDVLQRDPEMLKFVNGDRR